MKSCLCFAAYAALFCCVVFRGHAAEKPLKLDEVMGLVRSNLTELSEAELSRAAAVGLIEQLGSKVQLVSTSAEASAGDGSGVFRARVFEDFGYLRVERVAGAVGPELQKSWESLASSNKLKGAILDLRYAKGADYRAAAELANLFVQTDRILFKAGETEHRAAANGAKIQKPLAVLVNRDTAGAPEALAAALRDAGAALLIGNSTAGEARLFQAFELSTGQTLRIGTVPVTVAGQPISATGVAPDVVVQVSSLDERAYYQDPFVELSRAAEPRGTNELAQALRGRRFNEAELVRRHREGADLTAPFAESSANSGTRVITDPALARAVDFLKGVSALRLSSPD